MSRLRGDVNGLWVETGDRSTVPNTVRLYGLVVNGDGALEIRKGCQKGLSC